MSDHLSVGGRPAMEEIHFRSDLVYISLVVNRRHRTARVVDFLAGNFAQKQSAIQSIALREGIDRVYTLVEREESIGWSRVGYGREGSIPGYYKRSDAYLMGYIVEDPPAVNEDGVPIPPMADAARAERTLVAARKLASGMAPAKGVRAQVLSPDEVTALRTATRGRRTYWMDERFGRTGASLHVAARPATRAAGKIPDQIVSAELQEPFGNAFIQFGSSPMRAEEAPLMASALAALVEQLRTREIVCSFAVAPSDNTVLAAAMLSVGFRKTGLLARHLYSGESRTDAILFTRRPVVTSADADAA